MAELAPDNPDPADPPEAKHFQQFAQFILFLQAVFTLGWSIYSWTIENEYLVFPSFFVAQSWFVLIVWVATLPEECTVRWFRISVLLSILSLNPFFVHPIGEHYRTDGIKHTMQEISHLIFILLMIGLGVWDLSKIREGFRSSIHKNETKEQKEERQLEQRRKTLHATGVFFAAGLVQLYFVLSAVVGFGQKSGLENTESILQLGFFDEDIRNYDARNQLNEYFQDMEALEGFLNVVAESVTGFVVNVTLVQYLVSKDVIQLWFHDIVTGQLDPREGAIALCHVIVIGMTYGVRALDARSVSAAILPQSGGIETFWILMVVLIGCEFVVIALSLWSVYIIVDMRKKLREGHVTDVERTNRLYYIRLDRHTKEERESTELDKLLKTEETKREQLGHAVDHANAKLEAMNRLLADETAQRAELGLALNQAKERILEMNRQLSFVEDQVFYDSVP